MIYRKFDWTALLNFQFLDAERVRIGRVTEIVDSADSPSVFLKVSQHSPESKVLLFDAASIGIIGDGWVMLDQPLRNAGAFFHVFDEAPVESISSEPDNGNDLSDVDAGPEPVYGACPYCGSASQAS